MWNGIAKWEPNDIQKKREKRILKELQQFIFELESNQRSNPEKFAQYSSLSQITPNLYLSGIVETQNPDNLDRKGIISILNMSQPLYYSISKSFYPHFTVLNICAIDTDTYSIFSHFEETIEFLSTQHSQGKKALVHCQAGISRSSTIVMIYLLWQIINKKTTFNELQNHFQTMHNLSSPFPHSELFFSTEDQLINYFSNIKLNFKEEETDEEIFKLTMKLYQNIYSYVYRCRPLIGPNDGFLVQIFEFIYQTLLSLFHKNNNNDNIDNNNNKNDTNSENENNKNENDNRESKEELIN